MSSSDGSNTTEDDLSETETLIGEFKPSHLQIPVVLIKDDDPITKNESSVFFHKVCDKYREAKAARRKIIKKKRNLDIKQKHIEKKIKKLESHPKDWERVGFDKISPIPEFIRGAIKDDVNAASYPKIGTVWVGK